MGKWAGERVSEGGFPTFPLSHLHTCPIFRLLCRCFILETEYWLLNTFFNPKHHGWSSSLGEEVGSEAEYTDTSRATNTAIYIVPQTASNIASIRAGLDNGTMSP